MLTPWGESVRPHDVWPEYPRPTLVRDGWTNLNGLWHYAIRPRRAPLPDAWDGEILVPFCVESRLSGVERRVTPDERLWYRRTFHHDGAEARTLLHFGAVDWHAAIFVNGAYAGSHTGGFDPFTVDVTEFLRDGVNELVVAVDDPTSAGEQPRGKQHAKPQGIWYTPVTGIWQTVWLETVPRANHIAEVRITPAPDEDTVMIEVLLARPTRDPTLAATVSISLDGHAVAATTIRPDRLIRIDVPDAVRWSPAQPTLYDADVTLVRVPDPLPRETQLRDAAEAAAYAGAGPVEAALDRVRTYFGMRTICVGAHPASGAPTLLLNGEPLFHLATLDQGWWPDGLLTPPADAALVHEIEFLKAAGFNAVRKHIKVEPARYYWHCDRLGLLVWQDMPSGFWPAQFVHPNDDAEARRTSVAIEVFERELARMVRGLRMHPSIVLWVLQNEGWGQFDAARLVDFVRGIDPSRPVNATSGWFDVGAGDVVDRHDYAPAPKAPEGDGRRARVIGEYGGIGWPVEGHLWNPDMRNWGYQTLHDLDAVRAAYAHATDAIVRARDEAGVCAAVYTQTTDVEGEVNGLLTYDRRVEKLPRAWLAQVHAPLTR
jgi:beta-galactosidase/beta-glucuronidase